MKAKIKARKVNEPVKGWYDTLPDNAYKAALKHTTMVQDLSKEKAWAQSAPEALFGKTETLETQLNELLGTTVLDEAKSTIYGRDLIDTYGEPKEHFDLVSAIWSNYLSLAIRSHKPEDRYITPQDVCILMALLKVARLAKSPDHHDSLVDLAGYVGLIERVTK